MNDEIDNIKRKLVELIKIDELFPSKIPFSILLEAQTNRKVVKIDPELKSMDKEVLDLINNICKKIIHKLNEEKYRFDSNKSSDILTMNKMVENAFEFELSSIDFIDQCQKNISIYDFEFQVQGDSLSNYIDIKTFRDSKRHFGAISRFNIGRKKWSLFKDGRHLSVIFWYKKGENREIRIYDYSIKDLSQLEINIGLFYSYRTNDLIKLQHLDI